MSAPDFKKMAEEYAAAGKVSGTDAIRRRAYLAGVTAALDAAAVSFNDPDNWAYPCDVIRDRLRKLKPA